MKMQAFDCTFFDRIEEDGAFIGINDVNGDEIASGIEEGRIVRTGIAAVVITTDCFVVVAGVAASLDIQTIDRRAGVRIPVIHMPFGPNEGAGFCVGFEEVNLYKGDELHLEISLNMALQGVSNH